MEGPSQCVEYLIVGGGIQGAATAYYLSLRQEVAKDAILVLERCSQVATQASGKAGGFLAKSWSSVGATALSFQLHSQLAETFGAQRIDYRPLTAYTGTVEEGAAQNVGKKAQRQTKKQGAAYLRRTESVKCIGIESDVAQVHPRLLTEALMTAALESGKVRLEVDVAAQRLLYNEGRDAVVGVECSGGRSIRAKKTIIAMGPWSSKLLPECGIRGQKAHSLTVSTILEPAALFAEYLGAREGGSVYKGAPEIYPRSNETYICGGGDLNAALPDDPNDVKPAPDAIEQLLTFAADASERLVDVEPTATQACFLPVSKDSKPLVGCVLPNSLYINAGHSVWGILLAPASALLLSELLVDGKTKSGSIADLTPQRHMKK